MLMWSRSQIFYHYPQHTPGPTMCLCKFGQNLPTASEDRVQIRPDFRSLLDDDLED